MAHGKLAKRPIHQGLTTRDGEGVVVGLVRERSPSGVSVRVDFSGAPVPERRFAADGAWVVIGTDLVRIVFAQYKAAGPDIEHAVVVRLPFQGVRIFLDSMREVSQNGHHYLESVKNAPSPVIDRNKLPNQTFTLDANILIAGFSGREACLDLYYSSPQVKVALNRGSSEYRAEPVARVTLTTRLLMDIHDELMSKQDTLPMDDGSTLEVEAEHD